MSNPDYLSLIELSMLAGKHKPRDPGPCRVCGAELKIGSMGGGKATEYSCGSPEADILRNGKWGSDAERAASEHRRASQVSISYHGDPGIGRLIQEVRDARRNDGLPTEVPVGFRVTLASDLGTSSDDESDEPEDERWVEWVPPGPDEKVTSTRRINWVHEGGDQWEMTFWHEDD